jgi:2-hydroxychromene-2-carboxylate isomerase
VRFFHDFSSPFSYLAATQIERIVTAHGARLEWSPILLGGLFRQIGTPDVPLFAMSQAKQAYVGRDLRDWARWWGVDYGFPSHFPMRSILPLRVAIAEPATTLPLYRAAWGHDRRIDDVESISAVLTEAGFDAAALVAATADPSVKATLRANTEAAEVAGACGVPTFQVWSDAGVAPLLVWGQDRLGLVQRMLDGWRPTGE